MHLHWEGHLKVPNHADINEAKVIITRKSVDGITQVRHEINQLYEKYTIINWYKQYK